MKATWMSIDGQMDKENVVHTHTHNGILIYLIKGNPVICDNMAGSWRYYAKWMK